MKRTQDPDQRRERLNSLLDDPFFFKKNKEEVIDYLNRGCLNCGGEIGVPFHHTDQWSCLSCGNVDLHLRNFYNENLTMFFRRSPDELIRGSTMFRLELYKRKE